MQQAVVKRCPCQHFAPHWPHRLSALSGADWRARLMLWPVRGGDPEVCVPLCIKMRGFQGEVTDYGRTGGC